MLCITVLGSGSKGNAILVEGSEGTLLVDAGFGPRSLMKRLALANKQPAEISALLLTHEHVDHACGAVEASRKWRWPIHATAGTLAALEAPSPDDAPRVRRHALPIAEDVRIEGFAVRWIRVPHDARDCCAFVLTDVRSGACAGIALDLGHVPDGLPDAFARLDLLVVESNHDEQMLAHGPYPRMLKQRISGGRGHLSNGAAAGLIASSAHRGLRGVVLAHLSETNNTPEVALQRTRDALRRAGWRRESLWAAPQREPTAGMALQWAVEAGS